jgi:hypothetical protein
MRIKALTVIFYLKPLFYKAFLSMIGDGFVIEKEKKRGIRKLVLAK